MKKSAIIFNDRKLFMEMFKKREIVDISDRVKRGILQKRMQQKVK